MHYISTQLVLTSSILFLLQLASCFPPQNAKEINILVHYYYTNNMIDHVGYVYPCFSWFLCECE